jgi:hypothetical protein
MKIGVFSPVLKCFNIWTDQLPAVQYLQYDPRTPRHDPAVLLEDAILYDAESLIWLDPATELSGGGDSDGEAEALGGVLASAPWKTKPWQRHQEDVENSLKQKLTSTYKT